MKRFFSAVGLCIFLLLLGVFAFLPTSQAENNILLNLLNLPAPPPPNPLYKSEETERPEDFFSKTKPPKDNAPLTDLMAYWKHQNQFDGKYTYAPKISEESLKRIVGEIEKDPESLTEFLNVLPKNAESAELVKRYYDQENSARQYGREWRDAVKKWLTYNSSYFSDELVEASENIGDADGYVTNQDELLALARVDWEKARPILERLLNDAKQPVSQTLARWAFYKQALKEGNTSDIEKYRRELQATVENRSEGAGSRDLAMDALVEGGDFEGRDDWYYTLLADETLFDLQAGGRNYTGLTTILNHSPPEKYIAKMLELVKSENQAVRNAAARNLGTLISSKNPEIIKALVPWLENPNWAKEVAGERRTLLGVLDSVVVPESVPGLAAMLSEGEMREVNVPASGNANTSSGAGGVKQVEYFPFRYAALTALAAQKDARAVPALRLLLPQVEEYEYRMVVKALLLCGGYSVSEQIEALEFTARNYSQSVNPATMANTMVGNVDMTDAEMREVVVDEPRVVSVNSNSTSYSVISDSMSDKRFVLGLQIIENTEPSNELVVALLDRIEVLERKEPSVAAALRKFMQNWSGAAVYSMLLRDLKNNKSDTDGIVKLLSLRGELREKQLGEVSDLRSGSALGLGISACLTEAYSDYDVILASDDAESKIAMLACARLIRARLPVREVAKNLESPTRLLALAAERYLESEDSPEARAFVLARHPNEAKILGARTAFSTGEPSAVNIDFLRNLFLSVDDSLASAAYFYFGGTFADLTANEKKLQKEVRENQELLGIYAYNANFIRIYKDRAVFSWEEDVSRYRERVLNKQEFDAFKSYLASERVDELAPFLSGCEGCDAKELLMLGRGGGRRVFIRADETPKFFAELEKMFGEMQKPPARLHYWLQKDLPGLEILFEDESLQARAVWKNGDDFRLLIDNKERREQLDREFEKLEEEALEQGEEKEDYDKARQVILERREQQQFENFAWHRFEAAKLSGLAAQPPGFEFIPPRDNLPGGSERQWKARAANFEIRADQEGLYKIVGGRATKIRAGYYARPLVTANARWAIATKFSDEGPPVPVRFNLLTGKELKIKIEQYPTYEAVAFIPSLNKVLLFGGTYQGEEHSEEYSEAENKVGRDGDYFLLDAETGLTQPVKGEIRPLAQQTFRPLQPTVNAGEFWAAIPDRKKNETQIGVYNAKTLAFKSIIKLPKIAFDSMNMWIDEKEQKIYFVYEGHLLASPLPKGA